MGRIRWALVLGVVATISLPAQIDEAHVKAAFLYNFAKFVEWPAHTFKSPKDPITICVFDQSSFANALEDVVAGKTVEGRPLVVRRILEITPKCNCQILFVGSSERKRFRALAASMKDAPILVVGEAEGFATIVGIINLKLENGKIRFEINLEAAERSQLRISSKLLSLAEIVKTGKEQ